MLFGSLISIHSFNNCSIVYLISAGNSKWVQAIEWFGRKDVVAAPTVLFKVDGEEAWQMKSHGPLTFFKVSFCLFLDNM